MGTREPAYYMNVEHSLDWIMQYVPEEGTCTAKGGEPNHNPPGGPKVASMAKSRHESEQKDTNEETYDYDDRSSGKVSSRIMQR